MSRGCGYFFRDGNSPTIDLTGFFSISNIHMHRTRMNMSVCCILLCFFQLFRVVVSRSSPFSFPPFSAPPPNYFSSLRPFLIFPLFGGRKEEKSGEGGRMEAEERMEDMGKREAEEASSVHILLLRSSQNGGKCFCVRWKRLLKYNKLSLQHANCPLNFFSKSL